MRNILIVAAVLSALVCGEAVAATLKYSTPSTITYKGVAYTYSSSSTCAGGKAALRMYRKWWCPVTSSASTVGTNSGSSSTTSTSTSTSTSGTTSTSGATSAGTTTTSTPTSYSATITWIIPTVRTDGSPLSVSELSGYEVYYTNDSGTVNVAVPVSGGSTENTVVKNLTSGNYYFSISAIDTSGLKSALSTMAAVTFP